MTIRRTAAAALLALALLSTGCIAEDLVRWGNDCHERYPVDESERHLCPRGSFWEMSRER